VDESVTFFAFAAAWLAVIPAGGLAANPLEAQFFRSECRRTGRVRCNAASQIGGSRCNQAVCDGGRGNDGGPGAAADPSFREERSKGG
jgi:hypothetical protein